MWHKAIWKGHPMRLELIRVGLLVELANHYTTKGALVYSDVGIIRQRLIEKKTLLNFKVNWVIFYSNTQKMPERRISEEGKESLVNFIEYVCIITIFTLVGVPNCDRILSGIKYLLFYIFVDITYFTTQDLATKIFNKIPTFGTT